MQPLTVIFIGPQGSGKGTQIDRLYKAIAEADPLRRIVDIQTGRRFRAMMAKQETFAEKKITASLNSGALQPNFLTYVLWGEAMFDQLDDNSHLLMDGFPRTVKQAEVLDEAMVFYEREGIQVINLNTPEDVVRARMHERARADDTEESIENRLKAYREDTMPVLDFYRGHANAVVHDIDGTATIDEVSEQILVALKLK